MRLPASRGSRSRAADLAPLRVTAVMVALIAAACADTADGPLSDGEAPDPGVDGVAQAAESDPAAPEPDGTVEIGDTVYSFNVTCQQLGAGEVLVIGAGTDPASGGLVELYLRAFLGEPYVGLRLPDQTLLEPSLDSPLDLYLQDDVVRASAIRFVKDLDLETGDAVEVGFGELEIHCPSYESDLPAS